ncbi:arsenate reductase/protein-tyrosine-phosphatase family protein [Curtobacterium ammoniigenes]|uniref:arsenate reductase/protein-tyrosine-phosphatase family protein n=1 Tax=Curtobacterium ammoniigenes TaxID=395387 RepID=UPI0009FB5F1D|nr:hypothetical protein [Curtobacterium ammoniigenes]
MSVGSGTTRTSTILFVCSGNICRSPLAALLLEAKLGPHASAFDIRSRGTIAADGVPMDDDAAAQARRLGLDPSEHRSAPLTTEDVRQADLILTAERSHRSAVVRLDPRAAGRTFTILQFARILQGLEPADLQVDDTIALAATVGRLRGVVAPPEEPEDDDVVDPYRRSEDVHRAVADTLNEALSVIAAILRNVAELGAQRT